MEQLRYDISVEPHQQVQDTAIIEKMVGIQAASGSSPLRLTLYENQRPSSTTAGEFVDENPWLQLTDTDVYAGRGGAYTFHKAPKEPNIVLPEGWIWYGVWGCGEWEYATESFWGGVSFSRSASGIPDAPKRRIPWYRMMAYAPHFVVSADGVIKGCVDLPFEQAAVEQHGEHGEQHGEQRGEQHREHVPPEAEDASQQRSAPQEWAGATYPATEATSTDLCLDHPQSFEADGHDRDVSANFAETSRRVWGYSQHVDKQLC